MEKNLACLKRKEKLALFVIIHFVPIVLKKDLIVKKKKKKLKKNLKKKQCNRKKKKKNSDSTIYNQYTKYH